MVDLATLKWSARALFTFVDGTIKILFKYIFMLKPKQLFIIIYVNVCVKRVYPHKTNNNVLFRYGTIPESQFSDP
jgi:hypothetical protein